jgi:hypothetical protein
MFNLPASVRTPERNSRFFIETARPICSGRAALLSPGCRNLINDDFFQESSGRRSLSVRSKQFVAGRHGAIMARPTLKVSFAS